MSRYEQELIANGASQAEARRHVFANEMQWFRNREAEQYAREQAADHPETFPMYAERRGD